MMFATLAAESLKNETFGAGRAQPGPASRISEPGRLVDASLGQSLDRYSIRSDGRAPEACPQNLASPRRCPFGGACHACPARAQAKPGRRREIDEPALPAGSGEPLAQPLIERFQARFEHDLSQVRVHSDAQAAASAEAMNAFAFTVGRDIFFGAGEYRPHTPAGVSLLAHELAHVVQQRRGWGGAGSEAQDESEADRARDAVLAGRQAPAMEARGVAPRAQDRPLSLSMREDPLTRLEKSCDLSTMCMMRTVYPDQFPLERVKEAFRKCKPGQFFVGDPCVVLHTPPPYLPGTTPARPKPGGGLNLAGLTTFKYGPLTVELPSSVTVRLQAALRSATHIEFDLKAESSGSFSFSAKLNGLPYVTISATASANVADKTASFGLTVAAQKKRCQAVDPITTREKIKTAGAKVQKAMNELTKAAAGPDRLEKMKDLGEGIYNIYDAVDKAKKPCENVAEWKFGVGAKVPWGDAEPGKPAPGRYLGVTGEVNF